MSLFLSRLNQKFKTKYKVLDELLLFCSAFFLRAFYVSRNHYLTGDSHDYLTLAKNLAFHHVFSLDRSESALAPTAFRPPLYPVVDFVVLATRRSAFDRCFIFTGNARRTHSRDCLPFGKATFRQPGCLNRRRCRFDRTFHDSLYGNHYDGNFIHVSLLPIAPFVCIMAAYTLNRFLTKLGFPEFSKSKI
jgi:hypothetical protein